MGTRMDTTIHRLLVELMAAQTEMELDPCNQRKIVKYEMLLSKYNRTLEKRMSKQSTNRQNTSRGSKQRYSREYD